MAEMSTVAGRNPGKLAQCTKAAWENTQKIAKTPKAAGEYEIISDNNSKSSEIGTGGCNKSTKGKTNFQGVSCKYTTSQFFSIKFQKSVDSRANLCYSVTNSSRKSDNSIMFWEEQETGKMHNFFERG